MRYAAGWTRRSSAWGWTATVSAGRRSFPAAPASSLDPAGRALLEQTLGVLHEKGMALAVATHDVDFAWRWADRALVFHQGRLERDAAPAEVFADTALLARCGLEQPLLWRAAAALGVPPPKHPEEFSRSACGGSRSEA